MGFGWKLFERNFQKNGFRVGSMVFVLSSGSVSPQSALNFQDTPRCGSIRNLDESLGHRWEVL